MGRSDLAPVYSSSDALVAAMDEGGVPCEPGSVRMEKSEGGQSGSCRLSGGGEVAWRIDVVAAAAGPRRPEPGDLGSGEELPEVHQEVCEHYGGAVVVGVNWFLVGDGRVEMPVVAGALDAYLFVAGCDGDQVESVCNREMFSGARVYVSVSVEDLVIEPSGVASGPVWLCYGSEASGRLVISLFALDGSVDAGVLLGEGAAPGVTLLATPGVEFQSSAALTIQAGTWSEAGSEELVTGRFLFHGQLLPPGAEEGVVPDDVMGLLGILTVGEP